MLTERSTSTDLYIEGQTPSRFWGDQWLRVSEKLLRGLNHSLTNRVTSLEASLGVLDPESPLESDVTEALSREVGRLHELLGLYRSMTAEALARPEAVRLQDIVPMALRLHEHHVDLKFIKCHVRGDAETEPVLIRQASLLRSVLVLLESVAGNTLRAAGPQEISVEYGRDGDGVQLLVAGFAAGDQLLFSGEGSLLYAVRAALAHAHGAVDGAIERGATGNRLEYDLRLPGLAAARRLERLPL